MFGLLPGDMAAEDVTFDVWPDNWAAARAFSALTTQWRVSMNGISGLDYAAIPFVLRVQRVLRAEWESVFDDLRVMESEVLTMAREKS